MPKQTTEHLLDLIKSLTKGEKRHFRLFVNRTNTKEEKLFILLFEHLDKYDFYDETKILKKIPNIKKSQLSNLKGHLYKQLLISLRQQKRQHNLDMQLRESLDYAKILYSKGMYRASLQILDKTKKIAIEHQLYSDALTVLEFEKHIESQHITGSMYPKAEQLTKETQSVIKKLQLRNKLSDLSLSMYGLYLQFGYVKDKRDRHFITEYFDSHLPDFNIDELDFHEKMFLYQSYVWYHYTSQDFINFYRYAQKWVDLFDEHPEMIFNKMPLYLKAIHNLLTAYFMGARLDKFEPVYQKLLHLNEVENYCLTKNEKFLHILFKHIHGINKTILSGDYENGILQMPDLIHILNSDEYQWDLNRRINFYYKMGCVYFAAGDLGNAIEWLNKVTNEVIPNFREDIQCYARILNLIAHFDLGNDILVTYQIKSTYRYLLKSNQDGMVLTEIFTFLRKTTRMIESELKKEFIFLKEKLEKLEHNPYERRPFLYLDIISWLDSKINGRSMAASIRYRLSEKLLSKEGVGA